MPVYWVLIAMMVVAGCANAIYHPADYAILNASVGEKHMGALFQCTPRRGFWAVFSLRYRRCSGQMGWLGDGDRHLCEHWHLMAAIMIAGSDVLSDVTERDHRENTPAKTGKTGWALLLTIPVVMGVLFYVGLSSFGHALGSFGVATWTRSLIRNMRRWFSSSLICLPIRSACWPGVGWLTTSSVTIYSPRAVW